MIIKLLTYRKDGILQSPTLKKNCPQHLYLYPRGQDIYSQPRSQAPILPRLVSDLSKEL